MDPNANLEEQLKLSRALVWLDGGRYATRLAELVIALDEWIRKGGFLPARWPASGPRKANIEPDDPLPAQYPVACEMCQHFPCRC